MAARLVGLLRAVVASQLLLNPLNIPRKIWQRANLIVIGYLVVGVIISIAQNLVAAQRGEPTAFAWAGSLLGQCVLLFWWLIVPALSWPFELGSTIDYLLK